MVESGERLDLPAGRRPTVDKHSTGGVGDKVSLILAPLVASCGAAVPQLSGAVSATPAAPWTSWNRSRACGPRCSPRRWSRSCEVGCVICAAGPGLAPADRRLYALRDVTGTVESIPLIASSIMSKKIAEGTAAAGARRQGRHRAFMRELPRGPAACADHGEPRCGEFESCHHGRCSPGWTTPLGRSRRATRSSVASASTC